jgi:hypothetical protein
LLCCGLADDDDDDNDDDDDGKTAKKTTAQLTKIPPPVQTKLWPIFFLHFFGSYIACITKKRIPFNFHKKTIMM